jgi:TRAP-type transport system small permease protein
MKARLINICQTSWRLLNTATEFGALLLLIAIVVLVTLSIIMRITLQYESSAWEEIARFLSLWVYFFGVAMASRENSHLRMGFLGEKITSRRAKQIMEIVFNLIACACSGLFFWWAVEYVRWSVSIGQTSLVLMVGMWVVQASFVAGSGLAVTHLVIHTVRSCHQLIHDSGGAK